MSKAKSNTPARPTRTRPTTNARRRNAERAIPARRGSAQPRPKVVFCDIGDILGDAVIVDTPPPPRLDRLDVFPSVHDALDGFRRAGYRCGIISNTGDMKPDAINA